jgi:ubiquinol-cytochrome c reductase iron-sulfur subunit
MSDVTEDPSVTGDGAHLAGDGASGNGAAPETFPVASFDDPHMQPLARNPRRAEAVIGICLFIGLLGFAAYGALYWQGGQTQLEAVFLGVGLFGFGFGLSAWGKYLLPRGPFVEDRHPHASSEPEIDAMTAAVSGRGKLMFRRRGFLGGLLGAGAAVMGVVLAFPLIRSLGPVPDGIFQHTHWRRGSKLVDITGRVIVATDLEVGGVLTVFPEGYVGNSMDQTMLIRPEPFNITTAPGRETWGPQGYLAFSKVCTHAGCPVGLYQEQTQQLLCPCHQSLFNVGQNRPANPVFGPAPRPLPQLPLVIDRRGQLRAQSDYDQPVGPGFWERSPT